ncbi:MAG: nucleotidyltransferase family protein, partial [Halobacteriales archaeon]|nr:nucleotidyltransferase family protein [Halobacteriales archaeon]
QTHLPPLRSDFERRFGKGVGFVCEDGLELDLHRLLVPGYFGHRLDPHSLFQDARTFSLAGRQVLTLAPELHLLHACYHAAIGHVTRLVSLRDVAELVITADVDTNHVVGLAAEWDGEAVVARAVRLTWDLLGLEEEHSLAAWAESYVPSEADRRRMAAYQGARAREASRGFDALSGIPGLRGRLAFLRAMLFPDREYLEAIATGRLGWLQRGASSLWKGIRA